MRPSGAGRSAAVAVLASKVLLLVSQGQVLQQKLQSLNEVSSLLTEHNHGGSMMASSGMWGARPGVV